MHSIYPCDFGGYKSLYTAWVWPLFTILLRNLLTEATRDYYASATSMLEKYDRLKQKPNAISEVANLATISFG